MRLPPVGLLPLLLTSLASAVTSPCPPQCNADCSITTDVDLSCHLPDANVTITGRAASSFKIRCNDEHGLDKYTCEDLPSINLGEQQEIRLELDLELCGLPEGGAGCVGERLGAGAVGELYLMHYKGGRGVQRGDLEGLGGLRKLAVYGDTIDKPNMTIPTEALSVVPELTSLAFNGVQLALRPGDFAPVPHLTTLELTSAGITTLLSEVFRPLKQLKKLIIFNNPIRDMEDGVFDGLESLQTLEMSKTLITDVSPLPRATPALPLTHLYARFCKLNTLPQLSNLTMLEHIEIRYNSVPLSLSPGALSSLPHLTYLDLSFSGISALPPDLLHGSTALTTLNLAKNKLQSIPVDVFKNTTFLKELDLSNNKIEELRSETFATLRNLTLLNLDGNLLVTFAPRLFSSLSSLRTLSVASNRLTRITAADLRNLGNLVDLNLQGNNITSKKRDEEQYVDLESTFSYLTRLQTLDLSHNQLQAAPSGVLTVAVDLQLLDLSYNSIQILENADMESTSLQGVIDVRHNNISRVNMYRGWSPLQVDAVSSSLRSEGYQTSKLRPTIQLGDNPFNCDCKLYNMIQRLYGYKSLITTEATLDVSDAYCASPPSLRTRPLRAVRLYELVCVLEQNECAPNCSCLLRSHTGSIELTCDVTPDLQTYRNENPDLFESFQLIYLTLTTPPQTLNLTEKVTRLNLSGLYLKELPHIPPTVTYLDLTNNLLSSVPEELFKRNVTLRVSGNPVVCDCWRLSDVIMIQDYSWLIEDYENVTCRDGGAVRNVGEQQLCSTLRAAVLGGTLAVLGVVVAVGAVVALKYRTHIRVWLYSRGLCARWLAIDDEDRKYDAFVSFCHEDTEFVQQKLLPGLEAENYKLCVHYRDWTPGEWIPAQIAQSVADSRRTIVVVSRKFLDSRWARAEFRTANISAIKERTTRVIVVLLEDVTSHKEVDPELKAYLATNTYLQWDDTWFWDKLKYAMPHKRKVLIRNKQKKFSNMQMQFKTPNKAKQQAIDARLTSDGVIINAAALVVPKHKRAEHIKLDLAAINNNKGKEFDCIPK